MTRATVIERAQQVRRLLDSEGYGGVSTRVRRRLAHAISPPDDWRLRVARSDLLRAAEVAGNDWVLPEPLAAAEHEPLTVAFVCVPPGPGAGGFTTMFRIIGAIERAGHRCIVYLHDRHGWSLEQHQRTIREWWPWVRAEIRDVAGGIEDAHAIFATSWESAYPVLAARARGVRFYLVQDFEPWFYPAGSEALLAEATYRFGFHGVTAGRWLADFLADGYGMRTDHFDFGCDLERYGLDGTSVRTGICLYSRPETPRRAFELGVAALDIFAHHHPETDIHLFGNPTPKLPFAAVAHGRTTPDELNRLYNRCIGGLVLSATNVSLVPHEMLAAGCIPVLNDAEHNRIVLDNEMVRYAPASPFELANALSELVTRPEHERARAAAAAAESVQGASWDDAGAVVERIVRDVVLERNILIKEDLCAGPELY
jgi:glycosyltransferase involved in cell wall biosynthesis